MALVRHVLRAPWVYRGSSDDFAPPPDEWQPNADERIWYVTALEEFGVVGLLTFVPRSRILFEIHAALLRSRTERGTAILTAALAWMFANSPARRIVAEVPECNHLAVRLAGRAMKQYGVSEGAFMKNGSLQNLICFGVSKCQAL